MRKCVKCGAEFAPSVHNQAYCGPACKRRMENDRRRLGQPVRLYDEEAWRMEEERKWLRAARAEAKNKWILENKTFAAFDVESTQLDADFGRMLCAVVKPLNQPSKVFSASLSDKRMVGQLRDELEKYAYIISWYGTGFDLPFLNTRLIVHGERPLGTLRHLDMYYTARGTFKFASNRLSMVTLSLFGVAERTPVVGKIWDAASTGDKRAQQYIIDHCQADVKDLERVFCALVPYRNLSATPLRGVGGFGPHDTIKEAKLA